MSDEQYRTIDKFDRAMGSLAKRPDVAQTRACTITGMTPLIGEAQLFTVQTFREREGGDTIFLQYLDGEGSKRLVLPSGVADAIARQRDALTTRGRKRRGREQAQARKARGEVPGFMKGKKAKAKEGDS
jgi:hypothetical protein